MSTRRSTRVATKVEETKTTVENPTKSTEKKTTTKPRTKTTTKTNNNTAVELPPTISTNTGGSFIVVHNDSGDDATFEELCPKNISYTTGVFLEVFVCLC